LVHIAFQLLSFSSPRGTQRRKPGIQDSLDDIWAFPWLVSLSIVTLERIGPMPLPGYTFICIQLLPSNYELDVSAMH